MYKLVLIRHGESQWNLENRFTGWHDVDLTETGVAQAQNAGKLMKDAGFEFDTAGLARRKIKHTVQRLGHSVEARNGVLRRTLFKVLAKKVGGLTASLSQTQDILNNMASIVHKRKTPNEVAAQSTEDSVKQFNTKRANAPAFNRPKLKVGTFVRRVNRAYKKKGMYKSNTGVQWDPVKYLILGVSKEGTSYRIKVTERVRNKNVTRMKWIPRADLQVLPEKDDAKSAKLLSGRRQSGAAKAKRVRPAADYSDKAFRIARPRAARRKGQEKRRAAQALADQW